MQPMRAILTFAAVAATSTAALAQDSCPACGSKRSQSNQKRHGVVYFDGTKGGTQGVVELKMAPGVAQVVPGQRSVYTLAQPQATLLATPVTDDDELKREILREVDRRIERHLNALREDLRRMLAQHGNRTAPRAERAPRAPQAPHVPNTPRLRAQAEAMRRRAAESRRAAHDRQAESRSSSVRVESSDGKATVRIEVDGKVIERTLRTDRPQSIDVPVPGGKITIRVDRNGRVSVDSSAAGHARAFGGAHGGQNRAEGLQRELRARLERAQGEHGQAREYLEKMRRQMEEQFKNRARGHGESEKQQEFEFHFEGPDGQRRVYRGRAPQGRGGAWVRPGQGLRELEQVMPNLRRQIEKLLEELEEKTLQPRERERDERRNHQRRAPRRSDREQSF